VPDFAAPNLAAYVPGHGLVMVVPLSSPNRQCFQQDCVAVPELTLPLAALASAALLMLTVEAGPLEGVGSLVSQACALIEGAYNRAPIVVLALSALLVLPAVALISLATQAGRRHRSRQLALRAAERRAQADDASSLQELPEMAVVPTPQQAWLTVEGRHGGTVELMGQVIRIGRHEDNDIRLPDWSVHRHHAVIERTPDEAFVITDLSGKDGSGVRVNGKRQERARLADGDVIELGRAKLRFENAPL
jgi:hypothetical protein